MSETSGNSEQPARATKMEEELEKLRAEFQGQCKVIDSDGKFSKTIKLHPTDLDIVFNFKVTGEYKISVHTHGSKCADQGLLPHKYSERRVMVLDFVKENYSAFCGKCT